MSTPWNRKKSTEPIQRARTTAPSSSNRESQHRPRPQPFSYRQQLHQRLNKYRWLSHYTEKCDGPQHAQRWKITFWTENTMLGESGWFTSKDAAKENAAMRALEWMDAYEREQAQAWAQAQEQASANEGPSNAQGEHGAPCDAQMGRLA